MVRAVLAFPGFACEACAITTGAYDGGISSMSIMNYPLSLSHNVEVTGARLPMLACGAMLPARPGTPPSWASCSRHAQSTSSFE